MPFIHLAPPDPKISIGIWKVEEDEEYFRDHLNIYEKEERILGGISHAGKRLEWLSSRIVLKKLLHIHHKVESLNEHTGQPYLSDRSFNISYTHTNMYSGAIASQHTKVSIDMENIKKKRNPRTSKLFMHPSELELFESTGDLNLFFLIWSAKETLYKIHGKRGIVFKENLLIQADSEPLKPKGIVKGIIQENGFKKEYEIYYHLFPEILLTYTFDRDGL